MANRNSTTLRQVLTQQKPLLPCTSTSNRNTTHGSWPKLDESVVIWDEFNLKTLNESYGDLLDVAVPDTLLASPQANQVLAGIVVNTAEDINHLISWNHGLMEPTLGSPSRVLDFTRALPFTKNIRPPTNRSWSACPARQEDSP